jgi:hypothetical protein
MKSNKLIISVHIPKSGGTSLLKTWRRSYGTESVQTLYSENPADPSNPAHFDPLNYFKHSDVFPSACRVVHGHFRPARFAGAPNSLYCVFIRHPIDTLVSISNFWARTEPTDALHAYCKQHALGLLELAQLPALRWLLSKTYLLDFDIEQFDFIGSYEHYSEEVERLSRLIGVKLITFEENRSDANRRMSRESVLNSPLGRELSTLLQEDIQLYERLLLLRNTRL